MGNGDEKDDTDKNIELFKIKKLIKNLTLARGSGTSMISLIVPPKDQISRVNKMLTEEMGTAVNIKSRVNKLSVLSAITSTQQRLKLYPRVPPNGLVMYCGTILTDEGKERKVNIDLEPFKPINTSLYLCDSRFHCEALTELLADDDTWGFIVMDGNGALFGTLSGNTRNVLAKFSVALPKKHGKGGQSALRFARLRLEKRHNFVRKVAEQAVTCFITNDKCNVRGIILAGSAEFKTILDRSDLFDPRLKKEVVKLVDVSYGGENGFNQAIELSQEALSNVKFVQEKKLITQFFDEIARDTGRYCFGLKDTIQALELGAVETLVIWEALETNRFELLNNQTGEISEAFLTPQEENDPKHFQSEEGVDLEIKDKVLVVEWFANFYKKYGCTLTFVTDRSQEGSQFCKGFGGFGGLLRWKVDFHAMDHTEHQGTVEDDSDEEETDLNNVDWDEIGF